MVRALVAACAALALAACADQQSERAAGEARAACRTELFEGDRFTHCIADPARHAISLRLEGKDGKPLRSLDRLRRDVPDPVFAMNAGMFDTPGMPIGLYVEAGKERHPLDTGKGAGNFHLEPNGVFYGDDGGWHVVETARFAASTEGETPAFATQSGPMLVIGGKLHPRFEANGASRHVRNGVGVDADGNAHFVISDEMVSFGRFARFFRERAKTPDALYLDGSVSALWHPAERRLDPSPPLGPLIVVDERAKAKR